MKSFKHRWNVSELLDQKDIPLNDLIQNLKELNTINTLLGGHRITICGMQQFALKQNMHIVEIGCGGGDNLYAIQTFLQKKKIHATLTGIDIKADCINYAKEQYKEIEFICSDYKKLPTHFKADIIFSSLFCHHFSDTEIIEQLIWMKEKSCYGFFINDLHRNPIAFFAIKIITKILSKSYLVKNDAPLSVARSFIKSDWKYYAKEAQLSQCVVQWHWAFRYLFLYIHTDATK